MDFYNGNNGYGYGGFAGLPLGFGMALAMNEHAMSGYSRLTEAEKEQIILRCRDAKSKQEMQRIVDSLGIEGDMGRLHDGPSIG